MNEQGWTQIAGQVPILLTAIHNLPHERKGFIKPRDIGTGDLVREACQQARTWGVISTCVQRDPNWYTDAPLRVFIKQFIREHKIRAVLDIHGRRADYPRFVEYFPNQVFAKNYSGLLPTDLVRGFRNNEQLTLAEDLEQDGVPCLAIEIRKDGRDINDSNPRREEAKQLLTGLAEHLGIGS